MKGFNCRKENRSRTIHIVSLRLNKNNSNLHRATAHKYIYIVNFIVYEFGVAIVTVISYNKFKILLIENLNELVRQWQIPIVQESWSCSKNAIFPLLSGNSSAQFVRASFSTSTQRSSILENCKTL